MIVCRFTPLKTAMIDWGCNSASSLKIPYSSVVGRFAEPKWCQQNLDIHRRCIMQARHCESKYIYHILFKTISAFMSYPFHRPFLLSIQDWMAWSGWVGSDWMKPQIAPLIQEVLGLRSWLQLKQAIDPTAHNGKSWTSSCCDSHRSILLSPMLTLSVAMNLWPVRRLIRHCGIWNLRLFLLFNPEQSGYSRWIWHHLFCFTCFRLKRTVWRWFTWAGSTPNGFLAASCFHLSFDTMPFINLGFFISVLQAWFAV